MKEYERFERIGTTPHRSYYIPFAEKDAIRTSATLAETFAEAEQGKTFAELFGEVQS